MMKTVLHSVLESMVSADDHRPAIEEPGRTVTHHEMHLAANRIASGLASDFALAKGYRVGLHLPVGIDYVTAALGVAKSGGVFVPLDLAAPSERQRAVLDIAAPKVVISDRPDELPAGIAHAEVSRFASYSTESVPLAVTGDDPSYMVFTSGSTGTPKAILGTHKGLSHFMHWEVGEFSLDNECRISQLAAPTFDVSLRDIFVPLLAGGTLCVPPDDARTNTRLLIQWLEASRVSLMHCVPSLFRQVIAELEDGDTNAQPLAALSHVLLAGEPLYGTDVQRWRALVGSRIELVNLYGPSETTLAKAFHRIEAEQAQGRRTVPVGKALPNSALLVVKDDELCDEGEIGEVFIKTPFMTKGYVDAPSLQAEAFVQNPLTPDVPDIVYRTGDMGRYLPDHVVELLGRRDNQVKVNGIRIELGEVESALMRHDDVETAVVVAHQSPGQEPSLAAYYVGARPLETQALRTTLANWLPMAMHPAYFVQMDELPVNLHGKVNRRALPQPADLLYQNTPYVAPSSATETTLASLWGEVLALDKVSVTHGFADLGGDSLKAIRLLSRVFQDCGVEVPLQSLFPNGNIKTVAATIDATGG